MPTLLRSTVAAAPTAQLPNCTGHIISVDIQGEFQLCRPQTTWQALDHHELRTVAVDASSRLETRLSHPFQFNSHFQHIKECGLKAAEYSYLCLRNFRAYFHTHPDTNTHIWAHDAFALKYSPFAFCCLPLCICLTLRILDFSLLLHNHISTFFFFLTWPPSPHHHTISFGMSTLFASFMTKAFHVFVTRPCFFGEETQNFAYFWHWKRSKNYKLQARWNRCAAEEMGFLKCSTDIPFYKCDQLLI